MYCVFEKLWYINIRRYYSRTYFEDFLYEVLSKILETDNITCKAVYTLRLM